jgi:hypothetical protein
MGGKADAGSAARAGVSVRLRRHCEAPRLPRQSEGGPCGRLWLRPRTLPPNVERATPATTERGRPLWMVVASASDAPAPSAKAPRLPRQSEGGPCGRLWLRPHSRHPRLCDKRRACHARARAALGGTLLASAPDALPPAVRKRHACHARAREGRPYGKLRLQPLTRLCRLRESATPVTPE